jgi:DNA gyrase inhibitor GyrI
VAVVRQAIDDESISQTLKTMLADRSDSDPAVLGIYVDAPFHLPAAQCRYFLAWEQDADCEPGPEVLTLPGGYYAHLPFSGPTSALGPALFAFHDQVLLPSAYALASTLFFERLRPQRHSGWSYANCERELFIKIRRKGELVI